MKLHINGKKALEKMKDLISMACEMRSASDEVKINHQREYILVREGAITYGACVDSFPKRINYHKIREILSKEDRLILHSNYGEVDLKYRTRLSDEAKKAWEEELLLDLSLQTAPVLMEAGNFEDCFSEGKNEI